MIDLLIDALATARLARLVTSDTLTRHLRAVVIRRAYRRDDEVGALSDAFVLEMVRDDDEAPLLATLVTCQWCSSVHCAVVVVLARRFFPRAWGPVGRALAFSQAAGILASTLE